MPFPPDSDTTDPNDAPRCSTTGSPAEPSGESSGAQDDRSPGWARRARTGSAVTAVAALAALGGGTVAHAAPAQTAQVAAAPLLAEQPTTKTPVHTVSPGDSLWAVAQRHGVAVDELMRWNDLSGAALLMPGQELRLSDGAPAAAGSPEKAAPPAEDPPRTHHVVRSGDSLWSISQERGVTVQELLEDNDLTVNSLLRPGQRLSVAAPAPAAVRTAATPEPAGAPRPERERAVGDTFLGRTYEGSVVDSANRHHEQLASRPAPSREEMRRLVHDTAVRMGVDPALALAHAYQESGFDHRAVSPADAVGAMQVIPAAGDWASGLVGRELDLLDPQDNVTAGVAIIRQLGRAAPSTDVAIAAYYQGLHGVKKYGMYDDTKQYVKNVKSHRERFGP
ncbi:LysM peptidoglycan-binding domain-containing protein [Kocuria sp. CPCC 205292]|uniref:LysM peptidoglycan-binding domain-containing protein n=1 Tax=Kocuria cellulosilytica TaxID=3071451 RepID=UPI0034D3C418